MGENLYVSTSGAVSRLNQLEILANNLANVDTVGFKADEAVFQATLESAFVDGRGFASGEAASSFVQRREVVTNHATGAVERTGRALDAALQGPGFFTIETPSGIRYTRAGSFLVNTDRQLSTPDGHPVLGQGGPITIGNAPVRVQADGQVVDDSGTSLGRLRIESFADPTLLAKDGLNLFRAPPESVGEPIDRPMLLEASLERSNVQSVRELAVMMILQRSFDASMQVLQADDGATERLIQEVSR